MTRQQSNLYEYASSGTYTSAINVTQSPKRTSLPLDVLVLLCNQPTIDLHGLETLTFGDQLQWKRAEIISKSFRRAERLGNSLIIKNAPSKQAIDQANQSLFSLQALYTSPKILFRNTPQVRSYLDGHPDVNEFLLQAWPSLIKHFGQDVEVVVELLFYPGEQIEPELVGWIQCTNDIETGLQKLDALSEEWFLHRTIEFNSRFNFNLEFK